MFLKKILYNRNLYIFAIFLVIFFLNFNNYVGNKLLLLLLYLSSFALFVTAIRKNVTALEFFFFIFLLLSFCFKFSYLLFFDKIDVETSHNILEGDFNLSISNYDKSTIIIIIGFISCIVASYLRQFIFNNLFQEKKFMIKKYFLLFYKKYRFYILFFSIVSLVCVWTINLNLNIYSKSVINTEAPPYLVYFFSWLYKYGLSVFVSLLIYVDYFIFKNKNYFFLGIFEACFTHLTVFSRAFVIFILSYIRGYIQLIGISKIRLYSNKSVVISIFLILVVTFLSIHVVSKLRSDNSTKKEYPNSLTFKETAKTILNLGLYRWVGIDGMLAVSQDKNLSFDFFKSSLFEERKIREKSFYMKFFFKEYIYRSSADTEEVNTTITPGIFAFLYYSGSIIFFSFSIVFIILFCALIEKYFFIFSGGNIILSNVIGYTLAQRLIHFGYLPSNTINYLLSFLITLLLVLILSKIIWK